MGYCYYCQHWDSKGGNFYSTGECKKSPSHGRAVSITDVQIFCIFRPALLVDIFPAIAVNWVSLIFLKA